MTVATEKYLDILEEATRSKRESGLVNKESVDRERDLVDNISSLEKELSVSKTKCEQLSRDVVDLKLLLADKELEILRRQPTRNNNPSNPSNKTEITSQSPSYASAIKRVRDTRPTLIAKLGAHTTAEECTASKVDNMLGLQNDGSIAQQMKVNNGNLVLRFLSEADRDESIRMTKSKMFDKVFAPSATFPFLVRFNDLPNLNTGREKTIVSELEAKNVKLKGCITSMRVLHSNATTNSHLVRVCVNSLEIKKSILAGGRVFCDFRAHRVSDVDAGKEVRRCLNCQRYGHSQHF